MLVARRREVKSLLKAEREGARRTQLDIRQKARPRSPRAKPIGPTF
jgi:hypothetical protein